MTARTALHRNAHNFAETTRTRTSFGKHSFSRQLGKQLCVHGGDLITVVVSTRLYVFNGNPWAGGLPIRSVQTGSNLIGLYELHRALRVDACFLR